MKYKDFFRNRTGRCRLALSILLQFIRIFKLSHGLEHYLQSKIYYVYFSFISGIKNAKKRGPPATPVSERLLRYRSEGLDWMTGFLKMICYSSKYSFASFKKPAAISTITAPMGSAAIMLTDCRLFIWLSADRSATGSRIS